MGVCWDLLYLKHWQLSKAFGYKRKFRKALVYSTSDIYFSAITPSATGGQPASAYFMMNDKIPGAVTTIVLLVNLTLYTTSIIRQAAFRSRMEFS